MVIPEFAFAATPRILFGPGQFQKLPTEIQALGQRVLLVMGANTFSRSSHWESLQQALPQHGLRWETLIVAKEPSPSLVNEAVRTFGPAGIDVVAAIGGGSVIDAGKAISAMLGLQEPVQDYLEGVGSGKKHPGTKLPFVAIPTTAGTGSETTKNAVISQVGENGFKKSLRHDHFVPDLAIIDPQLAVSCPPRLTAACGLDALSQLLESYVSPQSTLLTDSLALGGLAAAGESLLPAFADGRDLAARSGMAFAALISGITLANAGLGIVHSLAGAIGGLYPAPHGAICGALLAAGTKMNIEKLKTLGQAGKAGLAKHARAGTLLTRTSPENTPAGCDRLVHYLEELARKLDVPGLRALGVEENRFDAIAGLAAIRNNPVILEKNEIRQILLDSAGRA